MLGMVFTKKMKETVWVTGKAIFIPPSPKNSERILGDLTLGVPEIDKQQLHLRWGKQWSRIGSGYRAQWAPGQQSNPKFHDFKVSRRVVSYI